MRFLVAALVLMASIWMGAGVRAHALDPGFVELGAMGGEAWRVLWRVPQVDGGPMAIGLELPDNCTPGDTPELSFDGRAYFAQWLVTCPGGLEGGRIAIPGLEMTQTDVLIRYEPVAGTSETARLTPATTSFVVPAPMGKVGVLRSYGALGVSHILTGIDHLLFVFVLLLVIRDARTLLGAVTAFTVAHSISLAAAALGWIVVPAPPVEAIIALSIMFLAAELMRPAGRGLRLTERYPWSVAFAFGLLHGLGFARALIEIGLPEGEVPLALFAFNLGVEVGQILFIAFVMAAATLLRRLYPVVINSITTRGKPGAQVMGYLAGGLAGFWFIARLAAF